MAGRKTTNGKIAKLKAAEEALTAARRALELPELALSLATRASRDADDAAAVAWLHAQVKPLQEAKMRAVRKRDFLRYGRVTD